MPYSRSTAARSCATRSSTIRLSLSEAETAMIPQTVNADSTTMLASFVRIFKWLSRFIFDLPGEKLFAEEISGTVLPIMNAERPPGGGGLGLSDGRLTGD